MQRRNFKSLFGRVSLLVNVMLLVACNNFASMDPRRLALHQTLARLVDRLDRPGDGYCFDILDVEKDLRLDISLFAHNCKPTPTNDSAATMDSGGRIIFVSPKVCVTVAGVNSRALPGTSVLLRKCDESASYFETSKLQRFSHRKDGRLELIGSGLCLAVGPRSATTYSQADRWRPLMMADCKSVEPSLSQWEFVVPKM